jgi:hypothetical protein
VRTLAIAALLGAVVWSGIRWGSSVAGGSDSYCYAHQAERWAAVLRDALRGQTGQLQAVEPLALAAPWPGPAAAFAPIGHRPSPTVDGAIVPVCPAGLSIAMAPVLLVGGRDAIFLVVPVFGALLVAAIYVLGSRYGTRIGIGAALLVAGSPPFLYQLIQPMSDVPAAALWLLAVASATGVKPRAPIVAGLATAAAVLMRPNLVPLAIPIGAFLLLRSERSWSERLKCAMVYALCAIPGVFAVALIQETFYGSPLASGYGSLDVLFSIDNVTRNASRYVAWMSLAHTPAWLLGVLSPVLLPGALTGLLLGVAFVNVAVYLPYVVFDEWWYLRFLLPAIAIALVLTVASFDALWRRLRLPAATTAVVVASVLLGAICLSHARTLGVFRLQQLEAKFERAGAFVRDRLPQNALIITAWHSGSIRFYAGRPTLVWEEIDPAWFEPMLAWTRAQRLEPFLLFETREEPLFRQRFAASPVGALDWPPMAEIASQVRIYRPDDRERYRQGTQPPTEYVR